MHRQVEITPADPAFDPHRQASWKFFWSIAALRQIIRLREQGKEEEESGRPSWISTSRRSVTYAS
jgi:hypothetical protein